MQIIDSHQHFWKYDPEQHGWITDEMDILKKDFLPNDIEPIYRRLSIEGCVAVQADQSKDETQFLVALARDNSFIKGVVGWVDLRAADIDEQLEEYSHLKIIKGFRHVLQSEQDRAMMLQYDFGRGIKALQKYGFSYDILIFTDQLKYATEFSNRFPEMRLVLDHMAKPGIKSGERDQWKLDITMLADCKNVYCKISGMVTEANWSGWRYEDFVPYLDVIVNAFGTDRIMFGSDWPVCLLAGRYDEMLTIVTRYFSSFSEQEQQNVFGKNAIQFYQLK